MNRKRLFIAINLPKEINQKIDNMTRDLMAVAKNDDLRWLKPENRHLTISFLGWQPDEAIDKILKSIKEIAKDFECPEIELEKIILFPAGEKPRMVWMAGSKESSRIISRIKDKLESSLIDNGVRFRQESHAYNAHINLARFRNAGERTFNALKMKINELEFKNKIRFKASSLNLMESDLKRSEAEYATLSVSPFRCVNN